MVFVRDRTGMPRSIAIHTANHRRSESQNGRGHGTITLMVTVHTDGLAFLHTALVVTTYHLQER